MNSVTLNALVDIGCFLTTIPLLLSGLVRYFFLPFVGGRSGSWVTQLGVSRHDRVLWHDITSFTFAVLLILHRSLHGKFFRYINRSLWPTGKDECGIQE